MNSLTIWILSVAIVGVNSHIWGSHLMSQHRSYPPRYPQGQMGGYPNTGNGNVELVEGTIDQLNNIDAKWVCTNQKTGDMMVIGTENGNGNTFPPRNQPGQGPWQQRPNFNPQRPQQPNFHPQQPNFNPQQPQQPQQPNYNPQQPQQPNYNPQQPQHPNFHPQQPNLNPQQPQQPNFHPQQPNLNPQQPQQPNFLPQQPQQPNPNPQQPQQPLNPQQPQQPQNPGFVEVPWTAFTEKTPAPSNPLQPTTTQDPLKDFDWSAYITTTASSNPTSRLEFDGTGLIEARTTT